jgi:hypothetical protein
MIRIILFFLISAGITICLARFVLPPCYKKVAIPQQIFATVNRTLVLIIFVCSWAGLYYLSVFYDTHGLLSATPTPTGPTHPAGPTMKGSRSDGKREAARVLALEALRQGTALSVAISSLPKLEKVHRAAEKLVAISPRYEEQEAAAKKALGGAATRRDQSLSDYLKKVAELSRYQPNYITGALDSIQNGDLTPREKIVAALLSDHVGSSRNGVGPDPAHWLSEYTQRFSDFVD